MTAPSADERLPAVRACLGRRRGAFLQRRVQRRIAVVCWHARLPYAFQRMTSTPSMWS